MLHLTSHVERFHRTIAKGDYHHALGLKQDATRLEIDVAAARLAERVPMLACLVSAVAGVLTNSERRAVYDLARGLREEVHKFLLARHGLEVTVAIEDYQEQIWRGCCRLLQLELHRSSQLMELRKVKALAECGADQIARALATSHLTELCCTPGELQAGVAVREIWSAHCPICHAGQQVFSARVKAAAGRSESSSAGAARRPGRFVPGRYEYVGTRCPHCGAQEAKPTNYEDTYPFHFSADMRQGRIVEGTGQRSSHPRYAVLSCSAGPWRPSEQRSRDPNSARSADGTADSSGGSSGFSWAAILLMSFVLRVGCVAAQHASVRDERKYDWRESFVMDEQDWSVERIRPDGDSQGEVPMPR